MSSEDSPLQEVESTAGAMERLEVFSIETRSETREPDDGGPLFPALMSEDNTHAALLFSLCKSRQAKSLYGFVLKWRTHKLAGFHLVSL